MSNVTQWDPRSLSGKQAKALRKAARIALARQDFLGFARWIRPGLVVSWHHQILARYLQAFADGRIRRLMIFAPPRHGKSELVSRILPAYIFGTRPTSEIIACSYSARLAQKMNLDAQRFMDGPRWSEAFPYHGLGADNVRTGSFRAKRNSDEFEVQVHAALAELPEFPEWLALPPDTVPNQIVGAYTCAGVGGSVTGMGADYALIDDPIKDAAQASSALQRENIWDWYGSTLYTRLQDPGSVLLMHTRWDEDDLAGRLLAAQERDPEADRWVVLNLPALYEHGLTGLLDDDPRAPGQALWPERFDEARLRKIRASIGLRWWNALYQGSPRVAEGSIFRREWFRTYKSYADFGGLAALKEIAFSADLAFKGDHESDYVVFQVWGRTHNDYYVLLDQARGQWDFVDTQDAFSELRARWPQVRKLFLEDKANGSALGSMLRKRFKTNLNIVPINPDTSKILRYYAVQPVFEAGLVFIPESAPWLDVYVNEMTTVRGGPGGRVIGAKNDDQADATAQVLLQWAANGSVDPIARLNQLRLLSGRA